MKTNRIARGVAAGFAAIVMLGAAPAQAGVIRVSGNGTDSGTCGGDVPCATLAQAVANAVDGDVISVGAGAYAGATINKSLSLSSSTGTGGAVITGGVVLSANGIQFGRLGKGFSLTGAGTGVSIAADEVVVRGNLFSDATTGVEVTSGSASIVRDNSFDNCTVGVSVLGATATQVRGNRFGFSNSTAVSLGSSSSMAVIRENRTFGPAGSGFVISGSDHLLWRNVVHGSPAGGFTTSGTPTNVELRENLVVGTDGPGFYLVTGSGWVLDNNAAINVIAPGFYLTAGTPLVLADNVAIGGSNIGFLIVGGSDHVLTGNSAVQNSSEGIILATIGSGVTVDGGNLYGNGNGNCGLTNSSPNTVTANRIYWGDAAGPGADPADQICGNIPAVVAGSPASVPAKMKMPPIK